MPFVELVHIYRLRKKKIQKRSQFSFYCRYRKEPTFFYNDPQTVK